MLEWRPDLQEVIVAHESGQITIWNPISGKPRCTQHIKYSNFRRI